MEEALIAELVLDAATGIKTLVDAWNTARSGGVLTPEHRAEIRAAQQAAMVRNDKAIDNALGEGGTAGGVTPPTPGNG